MTPQEFEAAVMRLHKQGWTNIAIGAALHRKATYVDDVVRANNNLGSAAQTEGIDALSVRHREAITRAPEEDRAAVAARRQHHSGKSHS